VATQIPDLAAAHLGETDHTAGTIFPVRLTALAMTNLLQRAREIAVPIQRVHAQVKMGVEEEPTHVVNFLARAAICQRPVACPSVTVTASAYSATVGQMCQGMP
jgi:hypothetical protein